MLKFIFIFLALGFSLNAVAEQSPQALAFQRHSWMAKHLKTSNASAKELIQKIKNKKDQTHFQKILRTIVVKTFKVDPILGLLLIQDGQHLTTIQRINEKPLRFSINGKTFGPVDPQNIYDSIYKINKRKTSAAVLLDFVIPDAHAQEDLIQRWGFLYAALNEFYDSCANSVNNKSCPKREEADAPLFHEQVTKMVEIIRDYLKIKTMHCSRHESQTQYYIADDTLKATVKCNKATSKCVIIEVRPFPQVQKLEALRKKFEKGTLPLALQDEYKQLQEQALEWDAENKRRDQMHEDLVEKYAEVFKAFGQCCVHSQCRKEFFETSEIYMTDPEVSQ